MFSLVSRKFLAMRNIVLDSVCINDVHTMYYTCIISQLAYVSLVEMKNGKCSLELIKFKKWYSLNENKRSVIFYARNVF